MTKNISYFF